MSAYATPEVLVSTDWVAEHGRDPGVRVVEVDVDTSSYQHGHVAGAAGWNWQTELQDSVQRDILHRDGFASLMSRTGISNSTTVILYGDNNNWFACWAFWLLKFYGHGDVRLMNGGRKKWIEEKRALVTETPLVPATTYTASEPDSTIRARRDIVTAVLERRQNAQLVDVRSPDEFTGRVIAPPGMTETAQRGGHIPGAANIPWSQAVQEDGTFKPADALRQLYAGRGIAGDREVIAYCRIGERSAHTWFVLRYLLGFGQVRNYDGSWTEWGNLVGAPIEKDAAAAASR
jgi:thiosulfate/3-mercaptopyruvate sulfurtransferase